MSALTEVRVAAPTLTHLPWWRGRLVKVAAIVGLMVLAYLGFKADYPWPMSLTFSSLSAKLDELQTWLIDQRTAESCAQPEPGRRPLAVKHCTDRCSSQRQHTHNHAGMYCFHIAHGHRREQRKTERMRVGSD